MWNSHVRGGVSLIKYFVKATKLSIIEQSLVCCTLLTVVVITVFSDSSNW